VICPQLRARNHTTLESPTYDNNGNTTSKTDSTGMTNYPWDFENRLSEGLHPTKGEQLVRCQAARECTNEQGEKIKTTEHRPAGSRHMNSRPQWESIPGRTSSAE
jgi:YD repeat-containing protein